MSARTQELGRALTAGLTILAAAGGALAAGAAGGVLAPFMGDRFESAHALYEQGHYQAAFDEFAALADDGHCEAARIASQMARYGRALYGQTFALRPARLDHWQHLPGCSTAQVGSR